MTAEQKLKALFKIAGYLLRKLAHENEELKKKVAFYNKYAKAEKIVNSLIKQGYLSEFQKEAKIKELMQEKDLSSWEKAAELLSSPMFRIGDVEQRSESYEMDELIKALLNS